MGPRALLRFTQGLLHRRDTSMRAPVALLFLHLHLHRWRTALPGAPVVDPKGVVLVLHLLHRRMVKAASLLQ